MQNNNPSSTTLIETLNKLKTVGRDYAVVMKKEDKHIVFDCIKKDKSLMPCKIEKGNLSSHSQVIENFFS